MTSIEAPTSPNTASTNTSVKPDAKKLGGQETTYTILRLIEPVVDAGHEDWEVGLEVKARSAEEAIRTGSAGKEGTYIAVPTRSWKPVKVTVEKIERMKLEDA